jgi:DNA repair photolyase
MAPILPGISDGEEQIRRLTRACLDAGADHVSPILLHLRPGVREHYFEWLERELPALVDLHRDAYRAGPYGLRQDRERVAAIVSDELSVRAGGCPAGSGSAGGDRTRIPQRTHRGP